MSTVVTWHVIISKKVFQFESYDNEENLVVNNRKLHQRSCACRKNSQVDFLSQNFQNTKIEAC